MRKHIWLNEYTLDSVSYGQSPCFIKFTFGDKSFTLSRQEANEIYHPIGQFLQETDSE